MKRNNAFSELRTEELVCVSPIVVQRRIDLVKNRKMRASTGNDFPVHGDSEPVLNESICRSVYKQIAVAFDGLMRLIYAVYSDFHFDTGWKVVFWLDGLGRK